MEEKIPVSFEYEGIQFDGFFSNTMGVGFNYYGLNLNGVHYGMLVLKGNDWAWAAGPAQLFEEQFMLDYFVSVVTHSET